MKQENQEKKNTKSEPCGGKSMVTVIITVHMETSTKTNHWKSKESQLTLVEVHVSAAPVENSGREAGGGPKRGTEGLFYFIMGGECLIESD